MVVLLASMVVLGDAGVASAAVLTYDGYTYQTWNACAHVAVKLSNEVPGLALYVSAQARKDSAQSTYMPPCSLKNAVTGWSGEVLTKFTLLRYPPEAPYGWQVCYIEDFFSYNSAPSGIATTQGGFSRSGLCGPGWYAGGGASFIWQAPEWVGGWGFTGYPDIWVG